MAAFFECRDGFFVFSCQILYRIVGIRKKQNKIRFQFI